MSKSKKEVIKEVTKPLMGWICPVCGRGNSPFSTRCDCPGNNLTNVVPGTVFNPAQVYISVCPYCGKYLFGVRVRICNPSGYGTIS